MTLSSGALLARALLCIVALVALVVVVAVALLDHPAGEVTVVPLTRHCPPHVQCVP